MRHVNWTDEQEALIRQHYQEKGANALAAMPAFAGFKPESIQKKANRMHLYRPCVGGKPWSAEHVALLTEHYPTKMKVADIAEMVGRKVNTVIKAAKTHGLQRRKKYMPAKAAPSSKPTAAPNGHRSDMCPSSVQARTRPASAPKPPVMKKEAPPKVAPRKKARKPAKVASKQWYNYPMSSPIYKAGEARYLAGKRPCTELDTNGRQQTVWRTVHPE